MLQPLGCCSVPCCGGCRWPLFVGSQTDVGRARSRTAASCAPVALSRLGRCAICRRRGGPHSPCIRRFFVARSPRERARGAVGAATGARFASDLARLPDSVENCRGGCTVTKRAAIALSWHYASVPIAWRFFWLSFPQIVERGGSAEEMREKCIGKSRCENKRGRHIDPWVMAMEQCGRPSSSRRESRSGLAGACTRGTPAEPPCRCGYGRTRCIPTPLSPRA